MKNATTSPNILEEDGIHLIFDDPDRAKQSPVVADILTGKEVVPGVSRSEALQAALKAGADVNIPGEDQQTGLHFVASRGQTKLMSTLIQHGADIELPNEHGSTALHRASREGRLTAVNVLIEAGADINAQTRYGKTALHYACNQERHDIIRTLIGHGADITLTDDKGMTAIEGCPTTMTAEVFKDAVNDRKSKERQGYFEGLLSGMKKKLQRGETSELPADLETLCQQERAQIQNPSHIAPSTTNATPNGASDAEEEVHLVRLRRKM